LADVEVSLKETYMKLLDIDDSIRFVGRMKNRKIIAFVRRQDSEPMMDEEMSNMAHYQASIKADMEEMFDGPLGKTNWMITCKEHVKLITMFLDDGLLIMSINSHGDHDKIVKKIQQMNTSL
jgi:hypothetical protein